MKRASLDDNLVDLALRSFSRQGVKKMPSLRDVGTYLKVTYPHPALTPGKSTLAEKIRKQRMARLDNAILHRAGDTMIKVDDVLRRFNPWKE